MTDVTNTKARRRQVIMLVVTVVSLFLVAFGGLLWLGPKKAPPPPEKVKEVPISTPGAKPGDQEMWRSESEGKLSNLLERLGKLESSNQTKEKELEELRLKLAESERNQPKSNDKVDNSGLLEKKLPQSTARSVPPPSGNLDGGTMSAAGDQPSTPTRTLVTVTRNAPSPAPAEQGSGQAGKPLTAVASGERPFLTSASFAKATMLSGLDAPTGGQASSDPVPVFFRLTNMAILPNQYRSRVKECHAYGVGWGDLPSERAHIRMESLSCILKNGKYIDTPIKGNVIGEDGKYGVRGRMVTKAGQMVANGIMAGLASGIGQGFSAKFNTISTGAMGSVSTVSGDDIWRSGLGQGVSNGMDMLAQYYIKNAEKLFPVIEVDSGRTVEIAFTKPLKISGLDEKDYSALVNRNRSVSR